MKNTDIRITEAKVYFLPVTMRVPLKFGPETVTNTVVLRTQVKVEDRDGRSATGWGETPLSVSWVWPSTLAVAERARRMEDFSVQLATKLVQSGLTGHPMEIGQDFIHGPLAETLAAANTAAGGPEMPYLGSLVAFSAFDIAVHDAYGNLLEKDVYETYTAEHMNRDLSAFIQAEEGSGLTFTGKYPADYLIKDAPKSLPVWHLVGGVDALEEADLTGSEPKDEHPLLLADWIQRDGLKCLKVKLRGTDAEWDYERMVRVGRIGLANGVIWLSADFNCTVKDPAYVNAITDRLLANEPEIYARTLYVEQPFPYDLEAHQIDVRSVSARKPLFLDESAHDWEFVRLGRRLGWSGVALKTCKTQTGALLSLCWAKAHGMPLMVQDLTNPMLAIIPHVRLAAHAGTIQGVECNAMQFYPDASTVEEAVHPGLYRRRSGVVDFSSLGGSGFGYRVDEIHRTLPDCAAHAVA
ncbi:mandelate racemase/muconate lactonizing enzyme family protein [Prosthecobacter sp. SYSU 5D2]|uniref:mandelate racemase/muconate lactonizing enzyme family protein n=1 Tax=Prosthecobacter sp. SYSU 5D2 TaxID=3134134 RepID=UPI0031FECFF7